MKTASTQNTTTALNAEQSRRVDVDLKDLSKGRSVRYVLVPTSDKDHDIKINDLHGILDGLANQPGTFVITITPHLD